MSRLSHKALRRPRQSKPNAPAGTQTSSARPFKTIATASHQWRQLRRNNLCISIEPVHHRRMRKAPIYQRHRSCYSSSCDACRYAIAASKRLGSSSQNPSVLLHLAQRRPRTLPVDAKHLAGTLADCANAALPGQHQIVVRQGNAVDLLEAPLAVPFTVARAFSFSMCRIVLPFENPALPDLLLMRRAIAALRGAPLLSIFRIFCVAFPGPVAAAKHLSARP